MFLRFFVRPFFAFRSPPGFFGRDPWEVFSPISLRDPLSSPPCSPSSARLHRPDCSLLPQEVYSFVNQDHPLNFLQFWRISSAFAPVLLSFVPSSRTSCVKSRPYPFGLQTYSFGRGPRGPEPSLAHFLSCPFPVRSGPVSFCFFSLPGTLCAAGAFSAFSFLFRQPSFRVPQRSLSLQEALHFPFISGHSFLRKFSLGIPILPQASSYPTMAPLQVLLSPF